MTLSHQNNKINGFFSQNFPIKKGITHVSSFALRCEKEVLLHALLALFVKKRYFLLNDLEIDLLTMKMTLNI